MHMLMVVPRVGRVAACLVRACLAGAGCPAGCSASQLRTTRHVTRDQVEEKRGYKLRTVTDDHEGQQSRARRQ